MYQFIVFSLRRPYSYMYLYCLEDIDTDQAYTIKPKYLYMERHIHSYL